MAMATSVFGILRSSELALCARVVLTNLSQLSASEVAHELAKRGFVEILKNFAEFLAVGAMGRKAPVEFP